MTIEQFRDYRPNIIGEEQIFRSAVCISLIEDSNGSQILFQVRAGSIASQPGDVCLPGGRIEEGESPEEAAVREICEELLLDKEQVEVVGPSDIFHTENIIIYPYVVKLRDYQGSYSKDEVDHVFTVPLQYFLDTEPETFEIKSSIEPGEDFPYDRIVGGRSYQWRKRVSQQVFYQYKGYNIWGLTGKIMRSFAELIRK